MSGACTWGTPERDRHTDAEQCHLGQPLWSRLNPAWCNSDPACRTSRTVGGDYSRTTACQVHQSAAVTLQQTQEYQTLRPDAEHTDVEVSSAPQSDAHPPNWLKCSKESTLADGSAALAAGVQELADQVKKMGSGLNEAADFLLGTKGCGQAVNGGLQHSP